MCWFFAKRKNKERLELEEKELDETNKTQEYEDKTGMRFLVECSKSRGEIIKEVLLVEGVVCVLVPSGDGTRSKLALPLENYKVYLPNEDYEKGKKILENFQEEMSLSVKEDLLENRDKWHIAPRFAFKRAKKYLKVSTAEQLFDYIENNVESANVQDIGLIVGNSDGSHYILMTTDEVQIFFNSVTYEIMDVL